MEIIFHTPVYVWPLLALLLWGGLKARKTSLAPWKALLIMPAVMLLWSFYSIMTHYSHFSLYLWALSIAIGIWLGSLTVRRLSLKFDKQQNLIEIGGSWWPLILSIWIFSLRYFLGATYALHPELVQHTALLFTENIAALVSGMLAGRLVGYWQRSKASPHMDLS
jgi:hypothetical protein